jgi:hypothetical protein
VAYQVRRWQEDQAAVHQEDHRRDPLRRAPHRQLQENRGLRPGDPHRDQRRAVGNPRPYQHGKLYHCLQFVPENFHNNTLIIKRCVRAVDGQGRVQGGAPAAGRAVQEQLRGVRKLQDRGRQQPYRRDPRRRPQLLI